MTQPSHPNPRHVPAANAGCAKGDPKTLPAVLLAWAVPHVGRTATVTDASHPRTSSQVWQLERDNGTRFYLKVSPSGAAFARERLAYRTAVPALGHHRAPQLIGSHPGELALLFTAAPGEPVKTVPLSADEQRAVYEQAGALTAHLHQAGEATGDRYEEAVGSFERAAGRAQEDVARAGKLLRPDERDLVLESADGLLRVGEVPVCLIHGDNRPRNWLWSRQDSRLALIDFEGYRPAPAVEDLVHLAAGAWSDALGLRDAFLHGFGRPLTGREEVALRYLAALDAVSGLIRGQGSDDDFLTARARRTLNLLIQEGHP
ncbi:phosphotransferase enzyme family protein [Streptomyces sp. NPDC051555]|uniref:phosphotransferase enzyme family protein n=1 Tax=Streptomyces sp. NPDC051555 TaxID=3365657 RepID=UPI00379AFF01